MGSRHTRAAAIQNFAGETSKREQLPERHKVRVSVNLT